MEAAPQRPAIRFLSWGLLGIFGLVFALVAAAPLLLRGGRLAWMLERLTPPMQGRISVGGGSLGWDAAFTLVMGQPTRLRLTNVQVLDPEGVEVLHSAELRAFLKIERDPLRVTIDDLRPGVARWRFARMRGQQGIGFLAAFRGPARAMTRAERRGHRPDASAESPAAASAPPSVARRGVSFSITSAHFDGLHATFDFPGWGLVLANVKGVGHLEIRAQPGSSTPVVSFDVRDIDARAGGLLRLLRGRALTAIPFDRVAIERIGTPGGGSRDLLLLVKDGATGASHLSGRALFGGLMARRAPGQPPPRMEIDAEWERAGDVLTAVAEGRGVRGIKVAGQAAYVRAQVQSSYRDLDARFMVRGLDVDYRAHRLEGLELEVTAQGPPYGMVLRHIRFRSPAGGQVEATGAVGAGGNTRLRLRLDQLATEPWLPRYLRPLLGGVASGWLAARGDIRADTLVLEGVDLTLARTRRGPLPRRLRLHTGSAPDASPAAGESLGESLVTSLRGARWQRGRLSASGVVAQGFGGRLTADAGLQVRDAAGIPLPTPRLDLDLGVDKFALEQALPGSGLGGNLSFSLSAHGPLDGLSGRLAFPEGASLSLFDQPYHLPRGAEVIIRGDELTIPRVMLGAPAGGTIALEGRVKSGQEVDLRVNVAGHRLERVPFLARALPSLAGRLDGGLRLRGHPQRPHLEGDVHLAGVSLRGVSLGDGDIRLAPAGAGQTTISGRMFRYLSLEGRVDTGSGGPRLQAAVIARGLRLDPFLPSAPIFEGGRLTVSGRFAVLALARAPLSLTAELESVALELGCAPAPPQKPGCLRLANAGAVRLRSSGGMRRLELSPSRLRTLPVSPPGSSRSASGSPPSPESEVTVAGVIEDGALDAVLEGHLGAELAGPLLRRWPVTVKGALDAAVQARGRLRDPRVTGTLRVRKPVAVRLRRLPWDVKLVSGAVSFDPDGVRSQGLELEAPGARLRVAGEAPLGDSGGVDMDHRPLAVQARGLVAGGFLARLFPTAIASAQGEMQVDGRVDGSLAEPRFSGQATFAPMSLRLRFQDARLDIRGGRLTAKGRRLLLEGLTGDLSPGTAGTGKSTGTQPPAGRVQIGPPGRPAEIEVRSLHPLILGAVRLPVVGQRLQLELPWLSLRGGDFNLVMAGDAHGGPLALTGDLNFGTARYAPGKQRRRRDGAASRIAQKLPETVRTGGALPLDLDVALRGQRLTVDPGWLPDVHLGVDVRVRGTSAKPHVDWQASGKGLYSVIALFLYRLFS